MILAVIQARMSSTRLPGKVLKDVLGEPMVIRQLERISRSKLIDQIVVATSTEPSDDPLAVAVEAAGYKVFRGSLDDVLSRFQTLRNQLNPTHIVRLTADCPLTDSEVIDGIISQHIETKVDYTSNVIARTFPRGLDAEVFTVEALDRLSNLELSEDEHEHVTLGFYKRPGEFTLTNFAGPTDRSNLRWTVDNPEDYDFALWVYGELYPHNAAFNSADIIALLDRHPERILIEDGH
jgi:spore coat polysaccharide biosynthesis protein SpsF